MYDTAEYGAVYLLDADRPALVDTGIGTNHERVLDLLASAGVDREELAAIAVTHVHLDHAGGAGFLAAACPNADVYVHERGVRHLADPSRLVAGTREAVGDQWRYYVEPEPVPEDRLVALADGDAVDLGSERLVAHAAPGHAPHQHVFHAPAREAVFVADAAGIYLPGRDEVRETTPPPQFDPERALADIETIRDLDPDRLLYPHFGPAPTGDRLDEYADRLRSFVDRIRRLRAEMDDETVVERVAATADTVDVWGEHKARGEAAMNARGVLAALDRA
ncbi:MBL fold metallo-hydrolase [Halobacteriales archaeon SW_7_68_16]|nr:MAG: MBL fold metallo-hydrolase [Halobacteriales archaeon SW_7_68_16]